MKKGFTLIELLAVMALIGILSLLMIKNVIPTIQKYKEKSIDYQKDNILNSASLYVNNYCLNNTSNVKKMQCMNKRKHLIWYGDIFPYFVTSNVPDGVVNGEDTLFMTRIVNGQQERPSSRLFEIIGNINFDDNVDYTDAEECFEEVMNLNEPLTCYINPNTLTMNRMNYDYLPGRVYFCLNDLYDSGLLDTIKYEGEECKGLVEFTYYKEKYNYPDIIIKCGDKYSNIDERIYNNTGCFD